MSKFFHSFKNLFSSKKNTNLSKPPSQNNTQNPNYKSNPEINPNINNHNNTNNNNNLHQSSINKGSPQNNKTNSKNDQKEKNSSPPLKKNENNDSNNTITNYSPEISFTRLPMLYRNNSLNEMWNGLKLSIDFKPTQFFNLDYSMNIEKNKKLFSNYSLDCSSFIPISTYLFPLNFILVGHKAPSQVFNFQSHILLGEKDKISIVSNYEPKYNNNMNNAIDNNINMNFNENINENDNNNELLNDKSIGFNNNNRNSNSNGVKNNEIDNKYSIEYSHEFKKGNFGIKLTNLESNSINFLYSIYKNLFFGMEFFKNPFYGQDKKYHFLKANYALFLKQFPPKRKFGFTFNYLSTLPGVVFNCSYFINNNFKLYLNTLFNKNELLQKLGQEKFSASVLSFYKNNYLELNSEINHKGEIKFLSKFFIHKNIEILSNFVFDHNEKIIKKKFKCFGLGFNVKNDSVEEKVEKIIEKQKREYSMNNIKFFNYNNIIKSNYTD